MDPLLSSFSQAQILFLASIGSLIPFLILIVASFMVKSQLSITLLPSYLISLYKRLFDHSSGKLKLSGRVIRSSDEKALQGVSVYALDSKTGYVLSHAITNNKGYFTLHKLHDELYTLSFVRNNYYPLTLQSISPAHREYRVNVAMTNKIYHKTIPHFLLYLTLFLLEKGFLGIVMASFLFCFIIEVSFGWHEVLPYFILSSFTLITCILHDRQ